MAEREMIVLGGDIEHIPREAPDEETPPLVARLAFGAVMGAVCGICFAGWEAAVVGWLGLAVPNDALGLAALGVYAATGSLCGLLAGFTDLRSGSWALVTLAGAAAWLVSGKFGMLAAEIGLPGLIAPLIGVPLAVVFAVTFAGVVQSEAWTLAISVAGFICAVVLLPVNLHFLGDPFTRVALTLDAAVVVLALVVGGAAGAMIGPRLLFVPFLLVSTLLGWGLAIPRLGVPESSWPAAQQAKPPIVLIVIDTLRADHLGTYGYDRPTSPNLDAFAQQAVVYTDASSTASWTLPSFASIVTGRHVPTHGAGLHDGTSQQLTGLSDVAVLAQQIRAGGYATAGIVTNPWMGTPYGFQRGFDTYDDAVGPWPMPVGMHPLHAMRLDPLGWPLYRDATRITDTALDFVAGQQASGWFLLVHYMDPHGPHSAPAEDREALGPSSGDAFTDDYDASIHYMDRELGRLLDGLPDDAWVFVTADHGEQLTEEREDLFGIPARTRHGHTLHRELLHVPLMVRGPGVAPSRVARPVSLVDVMPTLIDVGRGEPAPGIAGVPLREVFGRAGTPSLQIAMGQRFGPEQQSVRQGSYKLIRREGRTALYNVSSDPNELDDLLADGAPPNDVAKRLAEHLPPIGAGLSGPSPSLSEELSDVLEALGYFDSEASPEPTAEPPSEPTGEPENKQ